MRNMGGCSIAGMKRFQRQLSKIQQGDAHAFLDACAKELAARLLAKAIERTPVGVYPKSTGKNGGTLRRGWTSKTHEEAESGSRKGAKAYADSLAIQHVGSALIVEIVNPVEYASYVEYGHRKVNGGWSRGRFMMTISEQELQEIAPKVLERKVKKFLEECLQ